MVQRSIRGSKPFRTSGVGYRDALIWQTVLEQAKSTDVVFVSGNSKDFAAEDGSLHSDLQADLVGCPNSVTLLPGVDQFIEKYVPAADQALAKAQQLLGNEKFRLSLIDDVCLTGRRASSLRDR